MNSFSDRFIQARKKADVTISQIAKKMGVSVQSVYAWENGAMPKSSRLEELAGILGVTVQWLTFGEGKVQSFRQEDGSIAVPMLRAQVSAGGGEQEITTDSIVRLMDIAPKWLNEHLPSVNKTSLAVFSIHGDSMDPTLKDSDIILVDSSVREISRDGLYVVAYDGMLFSKRFQPVPGHKLIMISDNPAYRDVEIDLNIQELRFFVLGRIVYSWSGEKR